MDYYAIMTRQFGNASWQPGCIISKKMLDAFLERPERRCKERLADKTLKICRLVDVEVLEEEIRCTKLVVKE